MFKQFLTYSQTNRNTQVITTRRGKPDTLIIKCKHIHGQLNNNQTHRKRLIYDPNIKYM